MPRRSTREEATKFMQTFFDEAKANLLKDVTSTMQTKRRTALLNEIDALDRVHARFYNWVNGLEVNDDAA